MTLEILGPARRVGTAGRLAVYGRTAVYAYNHPAVGWGTLTLI